jgi:hypothetical protein
MDYLRSCYKSSMRLYSDRPDVLTDGAWHFCEPGAKLAPMPHIFGSQIWTPKNMAIDPAVGEVLGRGPWFNGKPDSRYVGEHSCGSADVWLNGIPYADRPGLELEADGTPTCCHAPPEVPAFTSGGDLEMDGAAEGGTVFSGARVNGPTQTTLAGSTWEFGFNEVLWDTDGYFSLGTDSITCVVPLDGVYLIGFTVTWNGLLNYVGTAYCRLRLSFPLSSDREADMREMPSGDVSLYPVQSVIAEVKLNAGDQVNFIGDASPAFGTSQQGTPFAWIEFRGVPVAQPTYLVTDQAENLADELGNLLVT